MTEHVPLEARERVLMAADRLFTERGYQLVTLRDIAQEVGIRHASLYYHFPQGKEELFIEVTARRMRQYREGLEHALQNAPLNWQDRLYAVAYWMLEQAPMYLGRMLQSDVRLISDEAAEQLRVIVYESLMVPLAAIFREALADHPDPTKRQRGVILAGMFLSLIEGIDNLPPSYVAGSKQELVEVILDVMLNGIV